MAYASPATVTEKQTSAIVAEVYGRQIKKADVDRKVAIRMAQRNGAPSGIGPTEADIRREIISDFVRKAALRAASEREGLSVSFQERADAIERLRDRDGNQNPTDEEILDEAMANKLYEKKFAEKSFKPSAEDMAIYAKNMKNRATLPERVQVCEIFLRVNATDDAATRQRKMQMAESLRNQLLAGADFAQLAATYSDSQSKHNGGLLKPFAKGTYPGALEEASFRQQESEIGPVIVDEEGYRIVKVIERIPKNTFSKDELTRMLEDADREKAFADYVEKLEADALGVPIDTP